jgi:WD40 repeat protein
LVGLGDATVTLSMDWDGVPVSSTKHTMRVTAAQGKALPVTPRLLRSLPHPDRTSSLVRVQFTPAGTLFATGYPSGIVQVWDVGTGRELRRVDSPRGYRGSSEYALVASDFSTLYVPTDGRKVTRMEDDPKKRYKIQFDGELLVWDLATGKPRPSVKPEPKRGIVSADLSPEGTHLVAIERGGYIAGEASPADLVWLYDLASGKRTKLGEGYAQAAFRPGGGEILICFMPSRAEGTNPLKLFDRDGKELAVVSNAKDQSYTWPTYSRDGERFAVVLSKGRINEPGVVQVFDAATRKRIAEFPSGGDYPFLAPEFSHDGRRLAAADYGGNLHLFDIDKGTVLRKRHFKGMGFGLRVAFSPDGTKLAAPARVQTNDRTRDPDPRDLPQPRLYLFDLTKEGEPEECVLPHGWPGGVTFSPDGKIVAVGGAGAVHLLDVSKRVP